MIGEDFDWRSALLQLFSATVNQQTLEEAAELMVSVSATDKNYHEECMFTLEQAVQAAESGDESIKDYINKSGYQVGNLCDAVELLNDFHHVYSEEYARNS